MYDEIEKGFFLNLVYLTQLYVHAFKFYCLKHVLSSSE